MSSNQYGIVEVFKTLQGEGLNVGRSAVFVRFAGCNLWSGVDRTREADALRNKAMCPLFCDTDFVQRAKLSLEGLVEMIKGHLPADIVVFTGGEPALQLDLNLVEACAALGLETCIETNGTCELKSGVAKALDHVCVSPKVPARLLKVREGTELKVVVPRYNPIDYAEVSTNFEHLFVSPEAATSSVGKSLVNLATEQDAARWCIDNPPWRLSLQTHKYLGIP
jgi:organic radical activating enzyme